MKIKKDFSGKIVLALLCVFTAAFMSACADNGKKPAATPTPTTTVNKAVTISPTATPTVKPTAVPTVTPTVTGTTPAPTATPTVKPTAVPTVTPTATGTTPAPTVTPTATGTTPAPTVTPTATGTTPAPTAIPDPADYETIDDEALLLVMQQVDPTLYEISSIRDFTYETAEYFRYTISDSKGIVFPEIIVDKTTMQLFYLDEEGSVSEFRGFPVDRTESAAKAGAAQDESEAAAFLKELLPEKLGLKKQLSDYELITDKWTTMLYGKECYCVNVYENQEGKRALAGVFYVAVDRTQLFRLALDNFVEVDLKK